MGYVPPPAPGHPDTPSFWRSFLIAVWLVGLVVLPVLMALLFERIAF